MTMAGATSTINGVTRYRHNSRPDPKAKFRAQITVTNESDASQGFFDARGYEIKLIPGETRTAIVPLSLARRMQANGKLKVAQLVEMPPEA
jgi:hypothetical protein